MTFSADYFLAPMQIRIADLIEEQLPADGAHAAYSQSYQGRSVSKCSRDGAFQASPICVRLCGSAEAMTMPLPERALTGPVTRRQPSWRLCLPRARCSMGQGFASRAPGFGSSKDVRMGRTACTATFVLKQRSRIASGAKPPKAPGSSHRQAWNPPASQGHRADHRADHRATPTARCKDGWSPLWVPSFTPAGNASHVCGSLSQEGAGALPNLSSQQLNC